MGGSRSHTLSRSTAAHLRRTLIRSRSLINRSAATYRFASGTAIVRDTIAQDKIHDAGSTRKWKSYARFVEARHTDRDDLAGRRVPNTDLSTSVVPQPAPTVHQKCKMKERRCQAGAAERAQRRFTPASTGPSLLHILCRDGQNLYDQPTGRLFTPRRLTPEPLNCQRKFPLSVSDFFTGS